MKYKLTFKGLDDRDIKSEVEAFLANRGFSFYGENNDQYLYRRKSSTRMYVIKVNYIDFSIDGFWGELSEYDPGFFLTDRYELPADILKFFDSLDFQLTYSHSVLTGQKITDWFGK